MEIKFLFGLGIPRIEGSSLSRAFKEGNRVHSIEGISPALRANMGGLASGSQLIMEKEINQLNNPIHSNDRVYGIDGISPTLNTMQGGNRQPFIQESTQMRIRKLTPTECERLMFWPSNWTKYGLDSNGKTYEMSNSRRYKHCGNGIVSSVSKKVVETLIPHGNHKVLSLCSGVDGSCLALDKERFEIVGFCEFDKYASDTLRYHHPTIPNFHDLTKIETGKLPEFDLLFASLPCQAFSIAGQRKGFEDTRGTLFYDMARILKDNHPKYFVFENVKGLLSHDNGKTFEIILETFCELGYEVDFEVLNAKYFGVAQNRERVFLFGRLK